MDTAYQI